MVEIKPLDSEKPNKSSEILQNPPKTINKCGTPRPESRESLTYF
jgi:hypothetical protein